MCRKKRKKLIMKKKNNEEVKRSKPLICWKKIRQKVGLCAGWKAMKKKGGKNNKKKQQLMG